MSLCQAGNEVLLKDDGVVGAVGADACLDLLDGVFGKSVVLRNDA